MAEKITVRPQKDRLINILDDINKGRIKIPKFQREFIWKSKQMLDLFDSMEKGYPIGSLLFWKPEVEFKYYETFGPYKILSRSKDVKYVLDGFQRLSTLFGVLSNPDKFDLPQISDDVNDFAICYDLYEGTFTYRRKKGDVHLLPLYLVVDTFDFLGYLERLKSHVPDEAEYNKLVTKAKKLAKTFVDYEIPYIDIKGGDISSSVDIFSRLNSTGTRISTDWMVSALSYVPDQFLFSERLETFLVELEEYNFENLSRDAILHCIEAATNRSYFDVKSEDLAKRKDFPELVESTLFNIRKAIRFLFEEIGVIEYRLLPYNSQLIFITEFFRINPDPNDFVIEKLKRWFWKTSYAGYFTITSISKQRNALGHFRTFAEESSNDPFLLDDNQSFRAAPMPQRIDFGSVRSKAFLLFMLSSSYQGYDIKGSNVLDVKYLTPNQKTTSSIIVTRLNDPELPKAYFDKKVDGSVLLKTEYKESYKRFFVTPIMAEFYKHNEIALLLEDRQFLIQKAEEKFVNELGLVYENDSPYQYS